MSLRLAIFLGLLLALALLEQRHPRRDADPRRRQRWPVNLGLAATGSLVLALLALLPLAPVGAALWARQAGWGLLPATGLPDWAQWMLALLVLDFALYLQHRAFHEIALLWPLHRVHHTDIVYDLTTGLRFHPAELVLSLLWKCALVVALGAPPAAVLLYEILLSSFSLWSHSNLRLPLAVDARLRRWLITPDWHRVHHAVARQEHDHNYGSVLTLWDRLLRSEQAQPREGHAAMRIGLEHWREPAAQRWGALLLQPWRRR